MAKFEVKAPDGSTYEVNAPEGATEQDAIAYVQQNFAASKQEQPAAVKAGGMLNDLGRQAGLTARYGLEGLANTAQIFTEPIRYLQDKVTPDREGAPKSLPLGRVASNFSDNIGLPSPQNANERVVGDAARLMAGSGGFVGGAQAAAKLPGLAGKALAGMAVNPASQVTAAAGGGLAGGASREAGGTGPEQFVSTLVGTFAGGLAPGAVQGVVARFNALKSSPMQLEGKIALALKEGGVDWGSMPQAVRTQMLADVKKATASGGDLNPDALRRLADFKLTNTTPTRGMLTLDPVQITREQNLAKIGANTADDGLQGLARVQNQNNSQLVRNLNDMGAATGSIDDAGRLVTSTVAGKRDGLRAAERAAWDSAKGSPGYRQPISSGVLSDINRALDEEGLMPFMNKEISNYMAAFQSGQRPFTPQDYRNLQSMLAREAAAGGNAGYAAGAAQRVLMSADVAPIQPNGPALTTARTAATMRASDTADDAARTSLAAVNQARGTTRAAYAYEDSSPLVRSILSDGATADPQRIAQRFIVNGTANEARTLAQEVGPQGIGPIKNAILAHLKSKALSGSEDEVGKFSQSAFNKAIKQIGPDKMRVFFSPEEITLLQANARAASYMQAQPVGSAVNNSNSGALAAAEAYNWLNATLGKIPLGKSLVVDPLKSWEVSIGQRQAQNLSPALLASQPKQAATSLLGPAAAFGGLLAAPAPVRP